MSDKRQMPRDFVVADRHVDRRPEDPTAIVEVEIGRQAYGSQPSSRGPIRHMPAQEAHDLGKSRARRLKREDKNRGTRYVRRCRKLKTREEAVSHDEI